MADATAEDVLGPPLPPGGHVELPGRGRTFVREVAGPPGAPTLVLLHGLGATADLNWFPVFAPLGRHYRVIALDHRGHGRGIRSRRRFRLTDCADDVAALADVLGIRQLVPVGYSMGGPIAQLVWHRHPELVEGLVLCATSRDFGGSLQERTFFSVLPAVSLAARLTPPILRRQTIGRLLVDRPDGPPLQRWFIQEVRRSNPAAVAEAAAAIGRFTSRAWIENVDVPTAVVVTTLDRAVPPRRQMKLAESIPGATVHPVEGDHSACVMQARAFTRALLSACDSVVVRARARAGR